MTVQTDVLFEATQVPAAETQVGQTVPAASRMMIDKFTGTNVSGATATLTVKLIPPTGTAGPTNIVVQTKAIASGECYTFPEMVGQVLRAGGVISVLASAAASINVRASGRMIT